MSKRLEKSFALATVLMLGAVAVGTFVRADLPKREAGLFSVLRAGQGVMLKESSGRYEITILDVGPGGRLSHSVTEVGPDYLVVQDLAEVTETRVPVYSLKAIIRIKPPKK